MQKSCGNPQKWWMIIKLDILKIPSVRRRKNEKHRKKVSEKERERERERVRERERS